MYENQEGRQVGTLTYSHYKYFNSFSEVAVFIRQNQPSTDVRFRLYTSESEVYRRHILTYKDGPRTGMVKRLAAMTQIVFITHYYDYYLPSKHKGLTQCWANAVPASSMLPDPPCTAVAHHGTSAWLNSLCWLAWMLSYIPAVRFSCIACFLPISQSILNRLS